MSPRLQEERTTPFSGPRGAIEEQEMLKDLHNMASKVVKVFLSSFVARNPFKP